MKEENLTCKVRAKKYKSYRGQEGKIAKNILNRNFKAEKPNEKWATDVTEFFSIHRYYNKDYFVIYQIDPQHKKKNENKTSYLESKRFY